MEELHINYNPVIKKKLFQGEYPDQDDFQYLINKEKINIFIDLTNNGEAITRGLEEYRKLLNKDTKYISFPIIDCKTTDNNKTLSLCYEILDYLKKGNIIYVHCIGGHGRSGIICSIIYGLYYNIDGHKAMKKIQKKHHSREIFNNGKWEFKSIPDSPTTSIQKLQVITILNFIK